MELKAVYQPQEQMLRLVIHECFYCKKRITSGSPQYCYGNDVSLMYFLCPTCTDMIFKNEIEQYNMLSQIDSIIEYFESEAIIEKFKKKDMDVKK